MRIIARLDVKTDRLVKGIQFEGLRSFGPPEQFASHYEREGADELLFMDAVASLYGRNSLLDMIARVSREVFIPLTVGGGLRSLSDIEQVLGAGADKVAINTAAIAHPQLIADAASRFGSSTIVVSIEAKRMPDGSYQAFVDNGREPTGRDVFEWAHEAQQRGAGEILVTSVDCDGTGAGFDLELVEGITKGIRIPVVVSGGAGSVDCVRELVRQTRIDGVALASLLHYGAVRRISPETAPPELSRIKSARIAEVHKALGSKPRIEASPADSQFADRTDVVGIVSSGTGNLASVRHATEAAGMTARIVERTEDLLGIDGLILPGVGAFGDGIRALRKVHLDRAIMEWARSNRPLMGICLGMQLLFSESDEFGASAGLNVFAGRVRALRPKLGGSAKSPHIGWNSLIPARSWSGTPLASQLDEPSMYFMHSYYIEPADRELIISTTRHGELKFCSAIQQGNIFGCQFHPERSGRGGLQVYRSFADTIQKNKQGEGKDVHAFCHA